MIEVTKIFQSPSTPVMAVAYTVLFTHGGKENDNDGLLIRLLEEQLKQQEFDAR